MNKTIVYQSCMAPVSTRALEKFIRPGIAAVVTLCLIHLAGAAAQAAPANDNFVNAIQIDTGSGTSAGNNVGATSEIGEPINPLGGGRTVWWCWRSPVCCPVTFNTFVSTFDTVLCAYT